VIDLLWALGGLVAGALAGSFLSTIVLRWPAGKSAMRGRSACDGCGRTLTAIELVPFVGALLSHGRCRTCRARIDPLHGRMEAACAAIGGVAIGLMPDIGGALWALLGWMLLTLAILDARHLWLPDALTLPLAFVGLTVGGIATDAAIADRVIGAVAGYGALALIAVAYRLARGREGLGLGDAKLLGALGGWFGWHALPFQLLTASALGLLAVGGAALAGRKVAHDMRVPLGTFLCVAAVPGWLLAEQLLR
jgi:leader peptidase (prepilin peptidase)/N-methyltransferase